MPAKNTHLFGANGVRRQSAFARDVQPLDVARIPRLPKKVGGRRRGYGVGAAADEAQVVSSGVPRDQVPREAVAEDRDLEHDGAVGQQCPDLHLVGEVVGVVDDRKDVARLEVVSVERQDRQPAVTGDGVGVCGEKGGRSDPAGIYLPPSAARPVDDIPPSAERRRLDGERGAV
jgi:hypothetical protein